jgi:hypothetical protein
VVFLGARDVLELGFFKSKVFPSVNFRSHSQYFWKPDPDPHSSEKLDPDLDPR